MHVLWSDSIHDDFTTTAFRRPRKRLSAWLPRGVGPSGILKNGWTLDEPAGTARRGILQTYDKAADAAASAVGPGNPKNHSVCLSFNPRPQ